MVKPKCLAAIAVLGAAAAAVGWLLYDSRARDRVSGTEGLEAPEIADGFNRVALMPQMRLLRRFVARRAVGLAPTGEAVDLGCGPGLLARQRGIGREKPSDPPADLDWDLWLGPRAERPFQKNLAPYKFRWWTSYSSQTANNGVHFLDLIRWLNGDLAPSSVCAIGGRYAVDDDRTIPDTLEVTYEFPAGRIVVFGMYETCGNQTMARGGYIEMRGTKGSLFANDNGFEVVPERGGQFQDSSDRMEPMKVPSTDGNLTAQHARNFLDCIKSREKPTADVEEGHRSTTMSLLAKISHATRLRLEWDAGGEQITNSEEANSMLHYEYRQPWKLG